MKERLENVAGTSCSSSSSIVRTDQSNPGEEDNEVAVTIKKKALEHFSSYHMLDVNGRGIVCLGLNSILDVSFDYPNCQSKLFTSKEWNDLKHRYPPSKYNSSEYHGIRSILQPVFESYRHSKTFGYNWKNAYKKLKKLETKYDPVFKSKYTDVAFCVFFIMQVPSVIRVFDKSRSPHSNRGFAWR